MRVHADLNQARSWIMRADEIEGVTPLQIKNEFALPAIPKYISAVYVPAGTSLRVGRVAAQEGWVVRILGLVKKVNSLSYVIGMEQMLLLNHIQEE